LDLLQLLDRPVAYHRIFAQITGSVTAGVFLSQSLYWSRRTSDPSGFFYKSREEWTDETYLSRSEQETARATLRRLGILIEEHRGMPRRIFYRIDPSRLLQLAENLPSSRRESRRPVGGNPADKSAGILPSFITENTTEITSQSFLPCAPRDGKKSGWCVSDINHFSEEFLDDSLTTWATQEAPAVNLDTATRAWIAYHLDHETQHRSRVALIRSWKGWIRNAQNNALAATAAGKDTTHAKRKIERSPDLDSLRAVGLIH
jgi:hypothetical protein